MRDLRTYFSSPRALLGRSGGLVKAVDGVSLDVQPGTTLGLVGESGCGKTTLARTILRLVPATSGEVWLDGVNWLSLKGRRLRRRRREVQAVFQDPTASLNPRMTVEQIVGEGLIVHRLAGGRRLRERVAQLLTRVGLTPDDARRYPHEFSGGQRQRIGIARALAPEPRFLVCDEPVSALDVSIQAQVLNLLADLQTELGLTVLFIAHNLVVVRRCCARVAVMYLGKIVEIGAVEQVFSRPAHPYTSALLAAVPEPRRGATDSPTFLPGEPPSPLDPPSGCAFHPRCPLATSACRGLAPVLRLVPVLTSTPQLSPDHQVACHHPSP